MINFRILPGDSVDKVLAHVRDAVADPEIKLRIGAASNPSPISDPRAPQFRALQKTIAQTFPDAVVAPHLVVGATDARYFAPLTPNVYRFSPARSIDDYLNAIRFYRALMVNFSG